MDNTNRPQPCSKKWAQLSGDSKVRFCESCDKSVHNLSILPRREAEALLATTKGKTDAEHLCVAYVPDAEGNPLTLEQCQARGISPLLDGTGNTSPAPTAQSGSGTHSTSRPRRWNLPALLAGLAAGCAALLTTGCATVAPLSQQELPPSKKPVRYQPPEPLYKTDKSGDKLIIVGDEGIYTELSREPLKKQQTKER